MYIKYPGLFIVHLPYQVFGKNEEKQLIALCGLSFFLEELIRNRVDPSL